MSVRLETNYLGFELATPLVASASPLGRTIEGLHRLEEAGAAAIVLPSLFEEQIEHDTYQVHQVLEFGAESYAEASGGYLPEFDAYNTGPDQYLDLVRRSVDEIEIPVIASLNGASAGGWTDVDETGAEVEGRYLALVEQVRAAVTIPLAVKVGPYFSSMANMARRLADAGADGLVLFNRFYQPDIHLETLEVVPNVNLSTSSELRLPLRWIAILRGRVEASLAATTGVHRAEDVLKLLLAGADVTMMASALLRHGPEMIRLLTQSVSDWLEEHEYESVEQMKGSMSQASVSDPAAFERANYMESLVTYSSPIV